jgi:amino acid transporter
MRRTRVRFSRELGLRDSVLLGVGLIIVAGIFLFPFLLAQQAGTYSLLAWVIGGIYTILTGLCFAENAARIPKAGGLYSYAHKELGNQIGFLAGWAFWIGYWLTISTETKALSLYSQFFLPELSDSVRLIIASAVVILLTLINYRGVREGSESQDIFTIGKIIPLLVFVIVGIFLIRPQNY